MASVNGGCDTTPDCSCGYGKMKVKVATKKAANPGRLYFKCPINGDHYGHFYWCDEYNSRRRQVNAPDRFNARGMEGLIQGDDPTVGMRFVPQPTKANDMRGWGTGSSIEMHVAFIFMGLCLFYLV